MTTITRPSVLTWIERGLFAVGIVLAAWCIAVFTEARYFKSLPPPPPPVARDGATTTTLPGESPGDTTSPSGTTSRHKFSTGDWVARLEAPSVHLSATVLEGSDDGTLARGAGHIEETAFPGDRGNVGIAGHRDTTFRVVRNLKVGDALTLTTVDQVFTYKISHTTIVNPEDVWVLDPTDHQTLTLVTCYPFTFVGHAPRRYIISADLVGQSAREQP